jgi:hypothetical protein
MSVRQQKKHERVGRPLFKRQRPSRKIPINRYPFTPATYPGRRPRFSFFFTSKGIYRREFRILRSLLRKHGLPSPDERYAILAYGSNACPHQLLNKGLTDVPVLYGRLRGAEAVYAGRKTQNGGYLPATLARKNGTRSSWVTLLTREQLAVMDISEGRRHNTYVLAELSDVQFFVGRCQFVPLYTYVNNRKGLMTHNGKAISLRSTNQQRAKRLLAAASVDESAKFLDYVIIPDMNPPSRHSEIIRR